MLSLLHGLTSCSFFSTFQFVRKSPTKSTLRQYRSSTSSTYLANAGVVAKSSNINSGSMFPTTKCTKNTLSTARPGKTVPLKKDDPCCFSLIRRKLREKGIPRKTRDIILQSWRASTKAQYDGFISRWIKFCKAGKTDPFQPNVNEVLTFLTKLFEQGLQYRSLGVARSALSTFLKICSNIDINSYAEVTRFMKGVFNSRPALPRLNVTWDVSIVLNYLELMSDVSLFQLSCKLSMLFLFIICSKMSDTSSY